MTLSSSKEAVERFSNSNTRPYLSTFPTTSILESTEQIRRFELLRLAFFVLKLRRYEQRSSDTHMREASPLIQKAQDSAPTHPVNAAGAGDHKGRSYDAQTGRKEEELDFHCNLLRHVIFQQVVTLIQLDAREQALQIIEACRN